MADPVATNIDVVQGATFSMEVTYADNTTNPPTPISLSGYRAHMQVRSRQGSTGTPLLNLASIGSAPSLTLEPNGRTGVVKVRISALATATLRRNCYYDVFIVDTTDATQAIRLVFGEITLYKSATIDDLVPDLSGEPESGGSIGSMDVVSDGAGQLLMTPSNNLTVVSDGAGGLSLVATGTDAITSDGSGSLTISE